MKKHISHPWIPNTFSNSSSMFRSLKMRREKARLCSSNNYLFKVLLKRTPEPNSLHMPRIAVPPLVLPSLSLHCSVLLNQAVPPIPLCWIWYPRLIQFIRPERTCCVFFLLTLVLCWFSELHQFSKQPDWKSWYERNEVCP